MSRAVVSLLMLLVVWAVDHEAASIPRTIRILSYNIHHGEGTDGAIDLPRLAALISRAAPDLVALQEVDRHTERAGGVNQTAELARLTRLEGIFGKAMSYEGGDYGVAVLSRWPVLDVRNQPLPGSPDREPRTALTVRTRAGGTGPLVQFTSTHFDQGRNEESRLAQAEFLGGIEIHDDLPAILAGDMNSRPDTSVMKTLEARWTNALTAVFTLPPIGAPPRGFRGDYVLFRPAHRWRAIEAAVLDDRLASDHRPVLAVLEWNDAR